MASWMFRGFKTDARRSIEVRTREMQNASHVSTIYPPLYVGNVPKMNKLGKNLWPLALFFWKIFMCTAAPAMNSIMKIV
jgi:hypothetical protein